jgi:hypothetical protein
MEEEGEEGEGGQGGGMILWDAPGFEDSGGCEHNIANAVNLERLLRAAAASASAGFVVLVVLDAPSLDSGRGLLVKRTLDMLARLLGGRAALEANLSSLVFGITKASTRVSLKVNPKPLNPSTPKTLKP